MTALDPAPHGISFGTALRVWLRVAVQSFGGPAGQIAVMHRILVEEKRWVSEARFLHALNYCMLLPGPEAQQLATYLGWLLHRTKGGLAAGLLFILPGFLAILLLSILYAHFYDTGFVQALFFGLKPAVLAVVVEAVIRIGKRALKNRVMQVLAGLAFLALFCFDVPFPWVVVAAGLVGFIGGRWREDLFYVIKGHAAEPDAAVIDTLAVHTRPSWGHVLRTGAFWLAVWWLPLLALHFALGPAHVFVQQAFFFSQAAVVTFGGAYAVLAYLAQQAVDVYGWLRPGEMLDGLGMAETTPGPLIMVVQFVGFLGTYRNPGSLDPLLAGVLGSVVTVWATFAPCFLWIFVGAPFIEHLRGQQALSAALSSITAAVVGVVLNLAVWFGLHVLFGTVAPHTYGPLRLHVPDRATLDPAALGIALLAFVLLFRTRWGMLPTLGICVAAGVAWRLVLG
jgi:chromate transporter